MKPGETLRKVLAKTAPGARVIIEDNGIYTGKIYIPPYFRLPKYTDWLEWLNENARLLPTRAWCELKDDEVLLVVDRMITIEPPTKDWGGNLVNITKEHFRAWIVTKVEDLENVYTAGEEWWYGIRKLTALPFTDAALF